MQGYSNPPYPPAASSSPPPAFHRPTSQPLYSTGHASTSSPSYPSRQPQQPLPPAQPPYTRQPHPTPTAYPSYSHPQPALSLPQPPLPPPGQLASRFHSPPNPPAGARPPQMTSAGGSANGEQLRRNQTYAGAGSGAAGGASVFSSYGQPRPAPAQAQAQNGYTARAPPTTAAEPDWRTSSFISSYYDGTSTPGTGSQPTSPIGTGYFPSEQGQRTSPRKQSLPSAPPPPSTSGPAYPSYAVARSATIAAPSSFSSASATYHLPSRPPAPPVPPAPPAQAQSSYASPRASEDSARYSLYSLHSTQSESSNPPAPSQSAYASYPSHPNSSASHSYAYSSYPSSASSHTYAAAAPSLNGSISSSGPTTGPTSAFSRSTSTASFAPSVAESNGTASTGAGGAAYPSRKQSLEHLRAAAGAGGSSSSGGGGGAPGGAGGDWRQRLEAFAIAEDAPTAGPPPARSSGASSLSPRPTMLVSPPLDDHSPSAAFPSYSYSASPQPEQLHSLPRNRSIDSSWSRPAASPSQPSFAPSGYSTSPEVSRRPSFATLSPNTSYATTLNRGESVDSFSPFAGVTFGSSSLSSYSHSSNSHSHPATGAEGAEEYVNPALLSNLAVYLFDHVPRGIRRKGAREYDGAFTGEEAVTCLARAVARSSASTASAAGGAGLGISDGRQEDEQDRRRTALEVARSLQRALWFDEVDGSDHPLSDTPGGGGVYRFLSSVGEVGEMEVPTAVETRLAGCFSPMCKAVENEGGRAGGCYAWDCPNRREGPNLHRTTSTLSSFLPSPSSPSPGPPSPAAPGAAPDNWLDSVPRSVVEGLDKREIDRQLAIYELIDGEQKHVDDLRLLETGFVEALQTASPPIIPLDRLPSFLSSVLLNHTSILHHASAFLSALRSKQAEAPVVSGIGKIVFSAAVEWAQAYTEYGARYPMGFFVLKEECANNPRFNEFVNDFRRLPGAHRRDFEKFHTGPWKRLMNYVTLLERILKYTSSSSGGDETAERRAEREYLEQAIEVIRAQGREMDDGPRAKEVQERVRLREWERDLVRKQGDTLDLELLDDSRKFFTASRVFRRVENPGFADQFQEAHLVLFDHYLVLTKAARADRDGRPKYAYSRRPIPLDLVQLKTNSFSEPPISRSSGFHLRPNRSAGHNGSVGAPLQPYPTTDSFASGSLANGTAGGGGGGLIYPISFYQLGHFDGFVHLYVDTPAARAEWEAKLKEAISLRIAQQEARRVVRLDPLADQTFGTTTLADGSLTASPTAAPSNQAGKPTCSVPLRAGNDWLVIVGCARGIFIGWRRKPRTMQQVVHLEGITQCAVLPEFSFLLVIANKVLVAYALEALIPSKAGSKLDQASKAPQRLSGQKDVSFFKVGKIGDADPRTLVIYAKKSGVKESVFKALEPVSPSERARGGGGGGHRGFLGLGSRPEWFRTYKEFFMPSLVTGLHFQRSKLALIGSRGVEIMDLESMRTMTVPDFPGSRGDRSLASLAKRCEDAATMGMFRIGDSKFLLAYSEFAFHVGRHGEPIPGPFIEWESKPEQVAYCAPYVFAISPTLIEVRHAFTGRLAQFITGSHMSLTYDGSAIPSLPPPGTLVPSDPAEEIAGPVDRRLHLSIRQGQFHVLHEVVIVA
ncbi:hypothetical protein JCM8097_002194 [Rhodosporidiobolus ruineniae]